MAVSSITAIESASWTSPSTSWNARAAVEPPDLLAEHARERFDRMRRRLFRCAPGARTRACLPPRGGPSARARRKRRSRTRSRANSWVGRPGTACCSSDSICAASCAGTPSSWRRSSVRRERAGRDQPFRLEARRQVGHAAGGSASPAVSLRSWTRATSRSRTSPRASFSLSIHSRCLRNVFFRRTGRKSRIASRKRFTATRRCGFLSSSRRRAPQGPSPGDSGGPPAGRSMPRARTGVRRREAGNLDRLGLRARIPS